MISHILGFLELSSQLQLATVSSQWRAATEGCLRQRRQLNTRDLRGQWLTNNMLRTVLFRLPGLRKLDIQGRGEGSLDVDIISEHCRRLEELDLAPFRLDPAAAERLGRSCPHLRTLRLPRGCEPGWLEPLLRQLPELRQLHLRECAVSGESVALLPAGLQRLTFYNCQLPRVPRQPSDRWPTLLELDLTLTHGDSAESAAALVAGCPRLERLQAACSSVTDQLLQILPSLRQLRHLELSACTELTEAGLADCMGRLRRLETLDLSLMDAVTDTVLDRLGGAEHLTRLTLGVEVYYQSVEFSMAALQRLVLSCPSLTRLRFALWEEERLQQLIAGLRRELSPDRGVTLTICETILEELEPAELPSDSEPLRITTMQAEDGYM